MRKMCLIIAYLSIFLCGCVTTHTEFQAVDDVSPAVRRFVSFHQLQKGLTQSEVSAVLGGQVIIGYEMPDARQQRYKPVVISNPHRVEEYVRGIRKYTIEYYLAGINRSDGSIENDELTPLVFQEDKLIGWGWGFLERIKK